MARGDASIPELEIGCSVLSVIGGIIACVQTSHFTWQTRSLLLIVVVDFVILFIVTIILLLGDVFSL